MCIYIYVYGLLSHRATPQIINAGKNRLHGVHHERQVLHGGSIPVCQFQCNN